MCQDSDPCAEIELNHLVPNFNAHPCAMTPICAIQNKTKAAIWSILNAHPCAVTPICAILNKSQRTYEYFVCIATTRPTCASQHNEHTHQLAHTPTHQKEKRGEITKLVIPRRETTCEIPRRRGVCSHTRHTLATMSEGASAESTAACVITTLRFSINDGLTEVGMMATGTAYVNALANASANAAAAAFSGSKPASTPLPHCKTPATPLTRAATRGSSLIYGIPRPPTGRRGR